LSTRLQVFQFLFQAQAQPLLKDRHVLCCQYPANSGAGRFTNSLSIGQRYDVNQPLKHRGDLKQGGMDIAVIGRKVLEIGALIP
jgi:hypothetical protein